MSYFGPPASAQPAPAGSRKTLPPPAAESKSGATAPTMAPNEAQPASASVQSAPAGSRRTLPPPAADGSKAAAGSSEAQQMAFCQGYLYKRAGPFKQWRKRFSRLLGTKIVYAEESNAEAKGFIDLYGCMFTEEPPEKYSRSHAFTIRTTDREWVLAAESADDRNRWINTIVNALLNTTAPKAQTNDDDEDDDDDLMVADNDNNDNKPNESERQLQALTTKRERVLQEIMETERDYVRDLVLTIEIFLGPARSQFPEELVNAIFANWESIHKVNSRLLAAMTAPNASVPKVFLQMADELQAYSAYCSNQKTANERLEKARAENPAFQAFLRESEARPECRQLVLGSFLLKPLQRVCKYPLLFHELLKCTPPDHPQHDDLHNTKVRYEAVAEFVNSAVDASEKIWELQRNLVGWKGDIAESGRKLVRNCVLGVKKTVDSKMEQRHVFAFTDMILFTSKTRKGKYEFQHSVPLDKAVLVEVADTANLTNAMTLVDSTVKKEFMLVFPTAQLKAIWWSHINDFINSLRDDTAKKHRGREFVAPESEAAIKKLQANQDDPVTMLRTSMMNEMLTLPGNSETGLDPKENKRRKQRASQIIEMNIDVTDQNVPGTQAKAPVPTRPKPNIPARRTETSGLRVNTNVAAPPEGGNGTPYPGAKPAAAAGTPTEGDRPPVPNNKPRKLSLAPGGVTVPTSFNTAENTTKPTPPEVAPKPTPPEVAPKPTVVAPATPSASSATGKTSPSTPSASSPDTLSPAGPGPLSPRNVSPRLTTAPQRANTAPSAGSRSIATTQTTLGLPGASTATTTTAAPAPATADGEQAPTLPTRKPRSSVLGSLSGNDKNDAVNKAEQRMSAYDGSKRLKELEDKNAALQARVELLEARLREAGLSTA